MTRRISTNIAGTVLSLLIGVLIVTGGRSGGVASASAVQSCVGNDFVGGWVGVNGATGTSIFDLAFVNQGATSCRLAGYPTIQGYRNGREYPLTSGHLKDLPFGIKSTIVAPRGAGDLVLTTSSLCEALNSGNRTAINKFIEANTYTLSVRFPHSSDRIFIYGLHVEVACGLATTGLGWR